VSGGSRLRAENLATKYLREHGETVADWDGICGELASAVMGVADDLLYVEGEIAWRYHMAPLICGLVHDAWCEGDALPPREWLEKMFGEADVEVSLNGDTIYRGAASAFSYAWTMRSQSWPNAPVSHAPSAETKT
jgi:hypothetical protein